ncbi:uncharacterized protein LOC143529169 [Bidens hawaiensis]|uniref:uncharacterized protein LOC143529169 n=1 Tax=Bidens hawaiensis TaxID=980011 RepID=UPI004048F5E1
MKLGTKKGKWVEELPFVLWADRTTPKNAAAQTPLSLVSRTVVVIPTEMVISTARSCLQNPETNDQDLANELDNIDKLRDLAKFCIATYQQRITKSYNKNAKVRRFPIRDLVLRKSL